MRGSFHQLEGCKNENERRCNQRCSDEQPNTQRSLARVGRLAALPVFPPQIKANCCHPRRNKTNSNLELLNGKAFDCLYPQRNDNRCDAEPNAGTSDQRTDEQESTPAAPQSDPRSSVFRLPARISGESSHTDRMVSQGKRSLLRRK